MSAQHCAGCGYRREYHDGAALRCPLVKSGRWRDSPPPDRTGWREIMRRDAARRAADYEAERRPYVPVVVEPPLVPARLTMSLDEIAAGRQQAMSTGLLAGSLGWRVEPWYAQAGDGTELSALRMARGPLRAVATWHRSPGGAWSTDVAYAWRSDVSGYPVNVGIRRLWEIMREAGAAV